MFSEALVRSALNYSKIKLKLKNIESNITISVLFCAIAGSEKKIRKMVKTRNQSLQLQNARPPPQTPRVIPDA